VERCLFLKNVEEWMKFGLRTRVAGSLKSLWVLMAGCGIQSSQERSLCCWHWESCPSVSSSTLQRLDTLDMLSKT
jgi:hypothetical protein